MGMDILSHPKSTSLLQPTKFVLVFSRTPNVQYFCQEANLPGFSYPNTIQPTPFINRKIPGNKIEYDPLKIEFLVEETLESWIEIWKWSKGVSDQTSFNDYSNLSRQSKILTGSTAPQYSDATLTVLSTQNNPKIRITYKDCFPTSLTGIQFSSKQNAEQTITAEAVIEYFYYDIEVVNA